MFYELPPFLNLIILMLPIIFFRFFDYFSFRKSEKYLEDRKKYKSYWVYRTIGPRNPSLAIYSIQLIWAIIMLIPIAGG